MPTRVLFGIPLVLMLHLLYAPIGRCEDFNIEIQLSDNADGVDCSFCMVGHSTAPPRSRWMLLPFPGALLSPPVRLSLGTRDANQVALLSTHASPAIAGIALFPGATRRYSADVGIQRRLLQTQTPPGFTIEHNVKIVTIPFHPDSSVIRLLTHTDSTFTCAFSSATVLLNNGKLEGTVPAGSKIGDNAISVPYDRIVSAGYMLTVMYVPSTKILAGMVSYIIGLFLAVCALMPETIRSLLSRHWAPGVILLLLAIAILVLGTSVVQGNTDSEYMKAAMSTCAALGAIVLVTYARNKRVPRKAQVDNS